MTQRQRLFAENYMQSGNVMQAAIAAGYSESYAKSRGYELLENVGIKAFLQQRNREIANAKIADMAEINEFWTRIMRDEENDLRDRLKASELRAKVQGAFIDRVELDTKEPLKVEIDYGE